MYVHKEVGRGRQGGKEKKEGGGWERGRKRRKEEGREREPSDPLFDINELDKEVFS